jgi:SPP1 gp7 family putative phage head morphogenesis protein
MPSKLFLALGRPSRVRAQASKRLAPRDPRGERARYVARLSAFWTVWSSSVKGHLGLRSDGGLRIDAPKTILEASFDQLLQNTRLDKFLESLGEDLSDKAESYMQRVVKIPTEIRGKEREIERFRDRNVRLIKNLGEEQISRINTTVRNSTSFGIRGEELAAQVQKDLDVGESRAMLIARDQTLKFYGQMNQLAQTSVGVEEYIWNTSNDERVREEHAALDGTTQRWDSPPDTGNGNNHPGEDFQCRCTATPIIPLFAGI